jgi:hypothetical protein
MTTPSGSADDRAALRDLAERYAAGVDQRDAELFLSAFRPDASLLVFNPSDASDPSARRGLDELATVITLVARHHRTYHLIGNSRYEVAGDEATGEVYCVAHHVDSADPADPADRADLADRADRASDHVMYIRYRDEYRREGDSWRIAERRVLVDWTATLPADLARPPG